MCDLGKYGMMTFGLFAATSQHSGRLKHTINNTPRVRERERKQCHDGYLLFGLENSGEKLCYLLQARESFLIKISFNFACHKIQRFSQTIFSLAQFSVD